MQINEKINLTKSKAKLVQNRQEQNFLQATRVTRLLNCSLMSIAITISDKMFGFLVSREMVWIFTSLNTSIIIIEFNKVPYYFIFDVLKNI